MSNNINPWLKYNELNFQELSSFCFTKCSKKHSNKKDESFPYSSKYLLSSLQKMKHFNNTRTFSLSPLLLLLQAPSKVFVEQVFVRVYQTRFDGFNRDFVESVAEQLQQNQQPNYQVAIEQLLSAVLFVIQYCVYHQLNTPEQILSSELFTDNDPAFTSHDKLKQLVAGTVLKFHSVWKEQALNTQIGLPKLVDMKWRVDLSTASNLIQKMAAPSVVIQLNVQNPAVSTGVMPKTEQINFEMDKETLSTMLKGLSKIRDQLASIK